MVLAFDEVDLLLDQDWGTDFLGLLRAWFNEGGKSPDLWGRRLNVCFAGSSEPYHLIPGSAESPFNVGKRVNVSDFSRAEIAALARTYHLPLGEGAAEAVEDLLGGHPFLTHCLLNRAANRKMSPADLLHGLEATDLFGGHLERIRKKIVDAPPLLRFWERLGREGADMEATPATALYRLGVLRRSGRRVAWRCALYRDQLLKR